jgi:hypothetical protein
MLNIHKNSEYYNANNYKNQKSKRSGEICIRKYLNMIIVKYQNMITYVKFISYRYKINN